MLIVKRIQISVIQEILSLKTNKEGRGGMFASVITRDQTLYTALCADTYFTPYEECYILGDDVCFYRGSIIAIAFLFLQSLSKVDIDPDWYMVAWTSFCLAV